MESGISIIIHTHNEEKQIKECMSSAKLLSARLILIDMESTDKTLEIAKQNGAVVFSFPYSSYVEPGREFGIKQAGTQWVFILDADERMTEELASEIKGIIESKPPSTYFKVPRKNIFAGQKWLKHGGWSPDYQIRCIDKSHFKQWPRQIHSTPVIDGQLGYLKNPIIHYFHRDLETMVQKTIVFENIESDLLFKAGKSVSTLTFFRKFCGELYRRLIRNVGFLDGGVGIIEAVYQAFSKTITYLFLYEKKRKDPPVGGQEKSRSV